MYYCSDCKEWFDDSELEVRNGETTEFWGNIGTTQYRCCPDCGSDRLKVPIYECSFCLRDIFNGDKYYITADKQIFCPDCIEIKEA